MGDPNTRPPCMLPGSVAPSPLVPSPYRRSARLPGLIADLQVPAVGVLDMEALEVVAHHIGPRAQAALLELRLHLVRVPRLHAPRDVIDDAGDRRRWRLAGARRRGIGGALPAVADDDLADVADLHRALVVAVVVADVPTHQIAIERRALAVVGDGV